MRAGISCPPDQGSDLDRLYQIDTPEALKECLNAFLTAVKGTFTLAKTKEEELLDRILTDKSLVPEELFQMYAENLIKAVRAVPMHGEDNERLAQQWLSNVTRFAAYKTYCATQDIRRIADEEGGDMDYIKAMFHAYNRYQAVEYNTAVARARTGKQWQQFAEYDNVRLFPNIKWLPSRSATPREEHMPFYNRVWPKDHPFWSRNQPGSLWNCKCDWQQTDEKPTLGNPDKTIVAPGLDKNPAASGQIFTDTAPYIKNAPSDMEKYAINITRSENLKWALQHLKGTSISNKYFSHPISFTGTGIKDYINQPFDDPILKNELVRQMPILLKH